MRADEPPYLDCDTSADSTRTRPGVAAAPDAASGESCVLVYFFCETEEGGDLGLGGRRENKRKWKFGSARKFKTRNSEVGVGPRGRERPVGWARVFPFLFRGAGANWPSDCRWSAYLRRLFISIDVIFSPGFGGVPPFVCWFKERVIQFAGFLFSGAKYTDGRASYFVFFFRNRSETRTSYFFILYSLSEPWSIGRTESICFFLHFCTEH